jgi:hypothetical protein
MKLPPKDPAEIKIVRFEFGLEVEAGRTISSVTVGSTTSAGTDPAPAAVLLGTPTIDNTNLYVLQRVQNGLAACDYQFRALATDNDGLKHLIVATLPVRTGT